MQARKIVPAALVIAVASVPFSAPWLQTLLTIALAKGISVLGVTLLLRAGQVSFGHALYFAIAAYAVAFLAPTPLGGDLILMLAVATAGATLSGLVVGLFVVRYRGIFFGMLNLAFSMIFWSILEKFYHYTGGADGIHVRRPMIVGIELEREPFEFVLFYVALAGSIGLGWVVIRFLSSPIGNLFCTIKTNETRLEYLGMSPRGTLLVGYAVSAALCGVGGAIMAVTQGIVTPEYAWWIRSGEMVFIAVLGGAGSVSGAFVGAIVYEVVRSYAAAFAADVWQLILGSFLLIIILFAPGGLIGIYNAAMNRLAGRRRDAGRPAGPVRGSAAANEHGARHD